MLILLFIEHRISTPDVCMYIYEFDNWTLKLAGEG
jgi:hypothetical protein